MKITQEELLEALCKDPEFQNTPECDRKILQPIIEAMPIALKDYLDLPLNFENYEKAQGHFLQYCCQNNLIEPVLDTHTPARYAPENRDEYIKEYKKSIDDWVLEVNSDFFHSLQILSGEMDLTKMCGYFNNELRRLYKAKEVTIGKAILVQPMFFAPGLYPEE